MCRRDRDDPLVRHFVDEYGVNLLKRPREHVECGQVYVEQGGTLSAPADLEGLLAPIPQLPEPRRGELMADLEGRVSLGVEREVGLDLLQGFLAVLGAAGVVDELRAGYRDARTSSVRFAFRQPTRDAINIGTLSSRLAASRLDDSQPLVANKNRYYLIGAVVRTPSVTVKAQDESAQGVELGASVLAAVDATGAVRTTRSSEDEVTYEAAEDGRALAIGVELYELTHDRKADRLRIGMTDEALEIRRGRPVAAQPVLLGGPEADALVEGL
jgi:hypothetical protein